MCSVLASLISSGKDFQSLGALMAKARSPVVTSLECNWVDLPVFTEVTEHMQFLKLSAVVPLF